MDQHYSTPDSRSQGSIHTQRFVRYISLARPSHYGKNILVAVGVVLAYAYEPVPITSELGVIVAFGVISTCLIASSNYVLNEIFDATNDQFHPHKHRRQIASGQVSLTIAYFEWVFLVTCGLLVAITIGISFFVVAAFFFCMAIIYNVPPLRLKDFPYLDVLTEGGNSPIRLMLGWVLVHPDGIPDLRLILVFWMAGAFAMAWKRLRELRLFQERAAAAAYRKSFAHYDEKYLKTCMALYALAAIAFVFAWQHPFVGFRIIYDI